MAQDCTFFFPQTEGTVWVRKGYDAKGNLQSVMSYQVDEVETLAKRWKRTTYILIPPVRS